MYGGENGSPYLPLVHDNMVKNLDLIFKLPFIDHQLYSMKKGHFIRIENIRRPDGKYKVPLTFEEFMDLKEHDMEPLVSAPRHNLEFQRHEHKVSDFLYKLYMFNSFFYGRKFDLNDREMAGFKQSLMKCFFIRDCILNYDKKSDKEKLVFESVKSKFDKRINSNGNDIFHDILKNIYNSYDNYMGNDISNIQNNEFAKDKAYTCKAVHKFGYCEGNCKVTWPVDLWEKNLSDKVYTEKNYFNHSDGLYYYDAERSSKIKLCSKVEVIGDLVDSTDTNYSKLLELETKLNTKKSLVIPTQDLLGNPETAISYLVKEGLRIEYSSPKVTKLIRDFIRNSNNDKLIINVSKIGWKGKDIQETLDCHEYQLPDETYGGDSKYEVYCDQSDNLYQTSGTLNEWKENVGRLCQGNPLLVLLASYALSGVLLKP
jgi:hypothetical protein